DRLAGSGADAEAAANLKFSIFRHGAKNCDAIRRGPDSGTGNPAQPGALPARFQILSEPRVQERFGSATVEPLIAHAGKCAADCTIRKPSRPAMRRSVRERFAP